MEDLPSVDVGLLLGSPDTLSEMKRNVNIENNRETNTLEVFTKKLLTHLTQARSISTRLTTRPRGSTLLQSASAG